MTGWYLINPHYYPTLPEEIELYNSCVGILIKNERACMNILSFRLGYFSSVIRNDSRFIIID